MIHHYLLGLLHWMLISLFSHTNTFIRTRREGGISKHWNQPLLIQWTL